MHKETLPRFHIFYGWYILASSFAILFFNSGARYSFGVAFKPMIAEFGWSRGSISFAFFLNMTLFAISLIAVGRFYDRYGPKWVIIISTVFVSAGYALISLINSLWQFYIFYGVFAAIGLGGTSIPLLAALISKWFKKWRGLAISLALSGNCLGQFAIVPLFTFSTFRYGWRISYLSIGLIMFLVNMTLALLVIKENANNPDTCSSHYKDSEKIQGSREIASSGTLQDLSLREAMHTSSFWLFLIAMFICGSGDFLVSTHLIPFVTDHGILATTAGAMLGWFGLMSLGGILLSGPASDLIGNKIPLVATFLIRFSLFILIVTYQNQTSFYLFSLIFGFTYLITAPIVTILVGELYGFSHIGLISGVITMVHHFGGGFWAFMGGWIFDLTGSYQLSFILSAVMALIALFCCMFIKEKRYVRLTDSLAH